MEFIVHEIAFAPMIPALISQCYSFPRAQLHSLIFLLFPMVKKEWVAYEDSRERKENPLCWSHSSPTLAFTSHNCLQFQFTPSCIAGPGFTSFLSPQSGSSSFLLHSSQLSHLSLPSLLARTTAENYHKSPDIGSV